MSASGAGRGRGWLNLNKNAQSPIPGGTPNPPKIPTPPPPTPHEVLKFTEIAIGNCELINKVKQLNVNDDGILFNQKIKYILEHWVKECKSKEDVERSFNDLYNACLREAELASKLIIMVASRSFSKQDIKDQNIRHMFLEKLQSNFDDAEKLRVSNPAAFRNITLMLGEFFHKARLANGGQFAFLSTPLMSSLEMLLDSNSVEDFKMLTMQLHLNAPSLKKMCPEKFLEILLKIRSVLLSDQNIPPESRAWLLLALDFNSCDFRNLSDDLIKFYSKHLGDAALATFQSNLQSFLSIQTTHSSKTLDGYQSSVNVLQVTSSSSDATLNDFAQGQSGQLESSHPNKFENEVKPGRPILGSGARLNRSKDNDSWRENSAGWNNQQKNTTGSGWGGSKKGAPTVKSSNKGWEHDDRFDNDYN